MTLEFPQTWKRQESKHRVQASFGAWFPEACKVADKITVVSNLSWAPALIAVAFMAQSRLFTLLHDSHISSSSHREIQPVALLSGPVHHPALDYQISCHGSDHSSHTVICHTIDKYTRRSGQFERSGDPNKPGSSASCTNPNPSWWQCCCCCRCWWCVCLFVCLLACLFACLLVCLLSCLFVCLLACLLKLFCCCCRCWVFVVFAILVFACVCAFQLIIYSIILFIGLFFSL